MFFLHSEFMRLKLNTHKCIIKCIVFSLKFSNAHPGHFLKSKDIKFKRRRCLSLNTPQSESSDPCVAPGSASHVAQAHLFAKKARVSQLPVAGPCSGRQPRETAGLCSPLNDIW